MWQYPFETIFWLDCADVFRSQDYKPRGYQADDLRLSLTYAFRIYIFSRNIFGHQDSAIHVYAHIYAFPDKAAHMYFSRFSPKPVLGMIEFLQIVQTMIN